MITGLGELVKSHLSATHLVDSTEKGDVSDILTEFLEKEAQRIRDILRKSLAPRKDYSVRAGVDSIAEAVDKGNESLDTIAFVYNGNNVEITKTVLGNFLQEFCSILDFLHNNTYWEERRTELFEIARQLQEQYGILDYANELRGNNTVQNTILELFESVLEENSSDPHSLRSLVKKRNKVPPDMYDKVLYLIGKAKKSIEKKPSGEESISGLEQRLERFLEQQEADLPGNLQQTVKARIAMICSQLYPDFLKYLSGKMAENIPSLDATTVSNQPAQAILEILSDSTSLSKIGVFTWDTGENKVWLSPSMLKILGVTTSDSPESGYETILAINLFGDLESFENAVKSKGPISFNRSFSLPDGKTRQVHIELTVQQDPQNPSHLHVTGIVIDMTEKHETEKRVQDILTQEGLKRWQEIVDALKSSAVFTIRRREKDGCHVITGANLATQHMLGLQKNPLGEVVPCDLIHKTPINCPAKAIFTGEKKSASFEFQRGERWFQVSLYPRKNPEGKVDEIIHIVTEITYLKEIQQKLEASNKKVSFLLSMLGHEFNNLLPALTYLEHPNNKDIIGIDQMMSATKMMKKIIKSILALVTSSYKQESVPQSLLSILENTIGMNARVLQKKRKIQGSETGEEKITTEWDIPPKANVDIMCDVIGVAIVFQNIIKNAIQSMEKREEGVLKISFQEDESSVKVSIQDTGEGMSAETMEKILGGEKGVSTKKDGHGIGMPIVLEIIREHGGTLDIQSEEGKGTTITVSFPRAGPSAIQKTP